MLAFDPPFSKRDSRLFACKVSIAAAMKTESPYLVERARSPFPSGRPPFIHPGPEVLRSRLR